MKLALLLPGVLMVLVGIALAGQFTGTGPELPTDAAGWFGWVLVLGGLLEMKAVDAVFD